MKAIFEELIGSFMDTEIGICDHFLSGELADSLQKKLLQLHREGRMNAAGIGNRPVENRLQDKRGDKITWIENETNDLTEQSFLKLVEGFIGYLNETCYAGINGFEFHYALYESGSSYQRHVDQFQNNADRKYSLISYLNTDWLDGDGGELWIYQGEKIQKILPSMQKTVFFRSRDCEHEVRKSFRSRMSITGWLKSS